MSSTVVYINIQNQYEDYAKCAKFLTLILNAEENSEIPDLNITLKKYPYNTVSATKLEDPLFEDPDEKPLEDITSAPLSLKELRRFARIAHFHIRVHVGPHEGTEFLHNLHYLALLSLKFNFLAEQKRISVFLVPNTGEEYPFGGEKVDTKLYQYASSYLRALIDDEKKGIFFGVGTPRTEKNINITKALNFKTITPLVDFFPIMVFRGDDPMSSSEAVDKYLSAPKAADKNKVELTHEEIEDLNIYALLFNDGTVKHYLDEAFKLKNKHRFGFANSVYPRAAIADYAFEAAFLRVKAKFSEFGVEINDFPDKFTAAYNTVGKLGILSFAVFSFLLSLPQSDEKKNSDIDKLICNFCEISNDISNALSQLVQNSLLYSTEHVCLLSFYVEHTLAYSNEGCSDCLRIILSDLSSSTITQTFSQNSETENKTISLLRENSELSEFMKDTSDSIMQANNDMIANKDVLKLQYFFNDFKGADERTIKCWHQFRQCDSAAHVGMALFANTMAMCSAKFTVMSNSEFECDPSLCFSSKEDYSKDLNIVFPGTEYNISIPMFINYETNAEGFSQLEGNYCENYESFAYFINSKSFYLDLKSIISSSRQIIGGVDHIKNIGIIAQNILNKKMHNKFVRQLLWTKYWFEVLNYRYKSGILSANDILIIDFDEIMSVLDNVVEDKIRCEVFIKGFINATNIFAEKNSSRGVYIAVINIGEDVMKCYEHITASIAIKSFPRNLQVFLLSSEHDSGHSQIHLIGSSYGEAIENAYMLAIENGVTNYDINIFYTVSAIIRPFTADKDSLEKKEKIFLVPFTHYIKGRKIKDSSMFFERVQLMAEKNLCDGNGYKINKTHTRLGNKVHTDAFYEMSFLFYRTIMANHVAFEIITTLISKGFDILKDNILFYGYASYSQAILMSLTCILKEHRQKHESAGYISYAVYQYNLQSEADAEEIQVYINNTRDLKGNIKVVQIVPISSTLTTFSKMWTKFEQKYSHSSDYVFKLAHNHTVIWVRDDGKKKDIPDLSPTDIEESYYYTPEDKCVKTKFKELKDCETVDFIFIGHSFWQRPEECKQCFPNDVLNEVPLIETDPTSTVPSQQIYLKKNSMSSSAVDPINLTRIAKLKGMVFYGHFMRGKNHFQYYIDTYKFFAEVAEDVKDWLSNLPGGPRQREKGYNEILPCQHIIFSPEHNTNVGFSQYVNTYYFSGNAEIISLNEDKEYRSNFICEHAALKNVINNLFENFYGGRFSVNTKSGYRPVRFYFVDDNIITGSTYRKANRLIQSLIPSEHLHIYTTNVFEKCFCLIDRLSDSSKQSYVLPVENFFSYFHIDISNTRRHGDSCVGCKLLADARHLMKSSATCFSIDYWSDKSDRFKPISFEKIQADLYKDSYTRLVLSNMINNIFKLNSQCDDEYCCAINTLFDYFTGNIVENSEIINIIDLHVNKCALFENNTVDEKRNVIKCLIKIISRPFFTFNYAIKKQVLKFMIRLSEEILHGVWNYDVTNTFGKIAELFSENREMLLIFLQDYVFEALVDLHSTYLMRLQTILAVLNFTISFSEGASDSAEFNAMTNYCWLCYSVYVQKTVNCSSDETRNLWLEHLLIYGNESNQKSCLSEEFTSLSKILLDEAVGTPSKTVKTSVEMFCSELFIGNGRILFDRIKQLSTEESRNLKNGDKAEFSDIYFLEHWRKFREADYSRLAKKIAASDCLGIDDEQYFYIYLNSSENILDVASSEDFTDNGQKIIKKRYDGLLRNMNNMILKKYGLNSDDVINTAILTQSTSKKGQGATRHRDMEIVSWISLKELKKHSNEKYTIKDRIVNILNDNYKSNILKKHGYYSALMTADEVTENSSVCDCSDEIYFVIRFSISDNMCKADSSLMNIVPVYFYISINAKLKDSKMLSWLIMRDIMTYRNSLTKYLMSDFTSDAIEKYAHSMGTEAILETDRAISHSPLVEDIRLLDLLGEYCSDANFTNAYPSCENPIDNTELMKWAIARNHCNTMTARLYNRVLRNINKPLEEIIAEVHERETMKLYVNASKNDGNSIPLTNIFNILPMTNATENDKVFALFSHIIDFSGDALQKNRKAVSKCVKEETRYVFNEVYVKNIIYRICLDALRFSNGAGAEYDNFLDRISNHYYFKHSQKIGTQDCIPALSKNLLKPNQNIHACEIIFSYEETYPNEEFDWLVIKNRVFDYRRADIETIKRKLRDPLDYNDGHISLMVEIQYMSKLFNPSVEETLIENMFRYNGDYFETRLPIVGKGE